MARWRWWGAQEGHARLEASEVLGRNRARTGQARIPDVAIYTARKKLVPPDYSEGFEALHAVRINADGGFEVRPWP